MRGTAGVASLGIALRLIPGMVRASIRAVAVRLPSGRAHIIQGDVLRIEGETYVIKELGGTERIFRADASTMKTERIQVGDRIEAKVDEQNRALSLLPAP